MYNCLIHVNHYLLSSHIQTALSSGQQWFIFASALQFNALLIVCSGARNVPVCRLLKIQMKCSRAVESPCRQIYICDVQEWGYYIALNFSYTIPALDFNLIRSEHSITLDLTSLVLRLPECTCLSPLTNHPSLLLSFPMSTSYSTKQWAAVRTQRGEMIAPPQTCFPLQCMLTCQPNVPLAAKVPPTIRRPSLTRTGQSVDEKMN